MTSTYDYANRIIRKVNADGTYKTTSYNSNGTVNSTMDERGNTTYYRYDGLNRQTEQWTPVNSVNGTTMYAYSAKVYDKAGRVTQEIKGKRYGYAVYCTHSKSNNYLI